MIKIKKQNKLIFIGLIVCIFLAISSVSAVETTNISENNDLKVSEGNMQVINDSVVNNIQNCDDSFVNDSNNNNISLGENLPVITLPYYFNNSFVNDSNYSNETSVPEIDHNWNPYWGTGPVIISNMTNETGIPWINLNENTSNNSKVNESLEINPLENNVNNQSKILKNTVVGTTNSSYHYSSFKQCPHGFIIHLYDDSGLEISDYTVLKNIKVYFDGLPVFAQSYKTHYLVAYLPDKFFSCIDEDDPYHRLTHRINCVFDGNENYNSSSNVTWIHFDDY